MCVKHVAVKALFDSASLPCSTQILERQQKLKPGEKDDAHDDLEEGDSAAIELKPTRRRAV
jgi:hypothetical protein